MSRYPVRPISLAALLSARTRDLTPAGARDAALKLACGAASHGPHTHLSGFGRQHLGCSLRVRRSPIAVLSVLLLLHLGRHCLASLLQTKPLRFIIIRKGLVGHVSVYQEGQWNRCLSIASKS